MKKHKIIKLKKIIMHLIYILKILVLCITLTVNDKSIADELNKFKQDGFYDIFFCESKNFSAICINLDKENNVNLNLLNEPYRIVLNFDNVIKINKKSIDKMHIKADYINKIRFGYPNKSMSRLVFELNQPAIISELFFNKDIKNRIINLQIGITKTSRAGFGIAKHVLSQNNGNILDLNVKNRKILNSKNQINLYKNEKNNIPKLRPKKINNINKNVAINNKKIKYNYIVFIDPGHGGKDPGAIGALGTLEKDITLQASLMLAKFLKKTNNITPILSRTTDIYLPLRKRIKLAKKNKADIFISLHADASKNLEAKGMSVFSLSDKASDKEADMIAKRENAVDMIPGIENNINDVDVFGTLIKMFQRQAMNDSSFLARNIIINLKKTKLAINRGHRFAGFAVLKAHDIPSVLIEIGFISNRDEEKKMLNKLYITNLSKNLTIAIKKYLLTKKY